MQALRDAGIVLIAITLLISMRVTKIDSAETLEPGSLMTRTDAAEMKMEPAPAPATEVFEPADPIPASRVIATEIDRDTAVRWVMSLAGDALDGKVKVDVAEHCSEILILIDKAAEATGREALTREVKRVVKAAPCPSA